jgi:hypothetical protein
MSLRKFPHSQIPSIALRCSLARPAAAFGAARCGERLLKRTPREVGGGGVAPRSAPGPRSSSDETAVCSQLLTVLIGSDTPMNEYPIQVSRPAHCGGLYGPQNVREEMEKESPKTLSVPVAGRIYFELGRNASYSAVKRGEIPVIKIGSRLRVPVVALEQMLGRTVSS